MPDPGFGHVEIVDAGLYDDRCAILFDLAGYLYINDRPGLCLYQGHSLYMPKVRQMEFRDLDGTGPGSPKELVIIADVNIAYDEVDDAPARTSPEIPPITLAIICGHGGSSPSCLTVTTDKPEDFLRTHKFQF